MAFSINVDGKEEISMTPTERKDVIDAIHKWMLKHPVHLHNILQGISEAFGEYNVIDDKPCESCGDIVTEYFLDLDK